MTVRAINKRQAQLDRIITKHFAPAREPAKATYKPAELSDDEVLARARSSSNGAFAALYDDGDISSYDADDSRADLALCNQLAAHTADPAQIDRLFRGGALDRPKWRRSDYCKRTIDKALAQRVADQRERLNLVVVSAQDFAAVDEPGAVPLLGAGDDAVIAVGSEAMFYGDGGAGKTTLTIDLAFHLAAGDPWLGYPTRRSRVLLIEAEGPRPLFRKKIKRKRDLWTGGKIGDRLQLLEEPWARFTFASEAWQQALAATIHEHEIDVIIVGPLTRVGMNEAGTLQQVRDFQRLVDEVRGQCGRALTLILVHHENKGGAVSGAWEGAGDTLAHIESRGNGKTSLHWQKVRWCSSVHNTTQQLLWTTPGEGFRVKEERDLFGEIRTLLGKEPWRTATDIAEAVRASRETVEDVLSEHHESFEIRTGEEARAVGRSARSKVYGCV